MGANKLNPTNAANRDGHHRDDSNQVANDTHAGPSNLWANGQGSGGTGGETSGRVRAFAGRSGAAPVVARPAPSPAEAMTLFSLVILLLIFVAMPLQQHDLVRGLLLTQWAILLGTTVVFLRIQTIDLKSALGLRRPKSVKSRQLSTRSTD